jgi:lipoprotein LprG
MRRYPTATRLTAAGAALLLAVAGCSRGGDGSDLPDGGELLQAAAGEMAQVETVAIRLAADAELANLPVREVDGVITRAGAAQGTAHVEQLGQRLEVQFVVLDGIFYYQLLGGWQELPLTEATDFYDPSAVLDPERGVANLLRTATDPTVERRDGDTYQVTASFRADALSALVPGAAEGTRGTVWIGVERPLLHRAQFPLPAGAGEPGTLSVDLSEFDQPVDIRAP